MFASGLRRIYQKDVKVYQGGALLTLNYFTLCHLGEYPGIFLFTGSTLEGHLRGTLNS